MRPRFYIANDSAKNPSKTSVKLVEAIRAALLSSKKVGSEVRFEWICSRSLT